MASEDTSSEYKIVSMTEEDEGMYLCEVSSSTHSLMSCMARVSLANWYKNVTVNVVIALPTL